MKKESIAYIYVSLTTLFWGVNFVIMKIVFNDVTPLQLAIIRYIIAGIVFSSILFCIKKEYRLIHKEDYFYIFTLGLIGIALQQILFLNGLHMTTATNSGIITGLTPVFVFLLSASILKERVNTFKILGIVISFVGVIVLTGNNISFYSKNFLGDLATLSAAFIFAIYTIMGKPMLKKYNGFILTAYTTITGSLIFCIIGLFSPEGRGLLTVIADFSFKTWSYILYISIVSSVISLTFWFLSLQFMEATKVAAITYFQPIVTAITAFFILKENLTINIVFGGVIVLFGVILTEKG